uniref:Putative tick male-specific salivary serine protease n=1 Tax=Rhipicephalus pulchellus TaxID=72859 RepID=L7MBV1_RHIPC
MTYRWAFLQFLSTCLLVTAENVELNPPGCGKPDVLSYIVNGKPAKEYQFPWMVQLHMRIAGDLSNYQCTGTIITKLHVLTAAHCFNVGAHEIIKIDVLYGNVDWRRANIVKGVKKLGHAGYNSYTNRNDIGVIKVRRCLLRMACQISRLDANEINTKGCSNDCYKIFDANHACLYYSTEGFWSIWFNVPSDSGCESP